MKIENQIAIIKLRADVSYVDVVTIISCASLRIYASRLKQATRGDTSFRCQTHLAATNANLRASPAAVSSSLAEFNYRDNNET